LSLDGDSRLVSHDTFLPLAHGDLIHLTPRAPPIVGDPGTLFEYDYFKLELDFPETKVKPGNENSVNIREEYAVISSLKFLLPSAMVGMLMGTGGETIRAIRTEHECDIQVSPWGSFHPAAAHSQGRTVQCFAETRGALCCSIIAILELIADDRGAAKFKLILPSESTKVLDGARLAELQVSSGATVYLLPAEPAFTDEQFLECKGSTAALAKLLPQLCSLMHLPLPYRYGTHYGAPVVSSRPRSDEPSLRGKRTRVIERSGQRAAKRGKPHAWGSSRARGRGKGQLH
jgi:hypothetical protein